MVHAKLRRTLARLLLSILATTTVLNPIFATTLNSLQLITGPLKEAYVHIPPVVDENQKLTAQDLLALKQLTEAEKVHLVLKIFEKIFVAQFAKTAKIDPSFIKKMELMHGDGTSANNLLNAVNRTVTTSGKVVLAKRLVEPIYDIQTLEHRQAIVATLLNDEALFNSLNSSLEVLSKNESDVLTYFDEESKAAQELVNQVYFGSWLDKFNDSTAALEIRTRLGNIRDLFNFTFLPTLATIQLAGFNALITTIYKLVGKVYQDKNKDIPDYQAPSPDKLSPFIPLGDHIKAAYEKACSFSYQKQRGLWTDTFIPANKLVESMDELSLASHIKGSAETIWGGIKKWYNPFSQTYATGAPQDLKTLNLQRNTESGCLELKSLGDYLTIYNNSPAEVRTKVFPYVESSTKAQFIVLGGLAAITAFQIYCSKTAVDSALFKRAITNYLHTKTLSVAHYIKALRDIAKLIKSNPILAQTPEFKPLFDLFAQAKAKLKQALNLLSSSTFQGDQATILSLSGRVLAAHKLLNQVKDELIPAIEAAGYVDMYVSTAKLVKEFEHERVTYCFPEYITSTTPYIHAVDFWNNFIGADQAIANTIKFGTKENPNNAILTGPNTGGKTTTIKGILINLLLAQTLAIAPARSLVLTPFALLNCYLNVTDDLGAGTSLFKAEVLRAKELLEGVRSLAPNQFSFTLMDEVFSGTSPLEGEQAALQFALQMSKFGNSVSILATHYQKMPLLETQLNKLAQEFDASFTGQRFGYKNYRVTMYKDSIGKWIRPFKIEEGISDVNVALDLLKEEGIL